MHMRNRAAALSPAWKSVGSVPAWNQRPGPAFVSEFPFKESPIMRLLSPVRRSFALLFFIAGATATGLPSSAHAEADARALIETLGQDALSIMKSPQDVNQKTDGLAQVLRKGLDLDYIGKFVLGTYWNRASDQQKAEYQAAFSNFVSRGYARTLAQQTVDTFKVQDVTKTSEGDSLVKTLIARPGGQAPLNYGWRVRSVNGELKVIDVVIEEVSLLITERSEFTTVAQRNGLDGLILSLKQKAG